MGVKHKNETTWKILLVVVNSKGAPTLGNVGINNSGNRPATWGGNRLATKVSMECLSYSYFAPPVACVLPPQ